MIATKEYSSVTIDIYSYYPLRIILFSCFSNIFFKTITIVIISYYYIIILHCYIFIVIVIIIIMVWNSALLTIVVRCNVINILSVINKFHPWFLLTYPA